MTGLVLASVCYFLLAKFGMLMFAIQPSNITLLWLPSGISLIMCLQWGVRSFPFIVAASFLANYAGMHTQEAGSYVYLLVAACIDGFSGVLSATLLKRFLPNGLVKTQHLFPFVAWVCLASPLITSLMLTANLLIGHYISLADAPGFVGMLILADSLGILLVYPVYAAMQVSSEPMTMIQKKWLTGAAIVLPVLLFFSTLGPDWLTFFMLPTLVILSFSVGIFWTVLMSSLSMVLTVAGTAQKLGPFVGASDQESRFGLMAFAFSSALTILGIALQNRQLKMAEFGQERWKSEAETDVMTGLFNRRAFFPLLNRMHQQAIVSQSTYAVAVIDLDNFKQINDRFGHAVGDEVLVSLAHVLVHHCRAGDIAARLGGDEFAMLIPLGSGKDALSLLQRVRSEILETKAVVGVNDEVAFDVSIGVALFESAAESENDLLRRADKALYKAKTTGRGRVVLADAYQ